MSSFLIRVTTLSKIYTIISFSLSIVNKCVLLKWKMRRFFLCKIVLYKIERNLNIFNIMMNYCSVLNGP